MCYDQALLSLRKEASSGLSEQQQTSGILDPIKRAGKNNIHLPKEEPENLLTLIGPRRHHKGGRPITNCQENLPIKEAEGNKVTVFSGI